MIYTVYILYSGRFNKHYTGFTSDLESRLYSHNHAGKGWTAGYRPWRLIFTREFTKEAEGSGNRRNNCSTSFMIVLF
ncbi:MAG: GIY-YIG nuclease family protein [Chitinophagaceae bacterium]|nr:GIY-YIG nuclease family protein [Chitinophagaceae bacterium]MCW5929601.1 GIY-YIG nuclease family protein [Chitinophagaceae bacterium]